MRSKLIILNSAEQARQVKRFFGNVDCDIDFLCFGECTLGQRWDEVLILQHPGPSREEMAKTWIKECIETRLTPGGRLLYLW